MSEIVENKTQYAIFSEPIQITEDAAAVMRVSGVLAKEGVYTFPAGPNGEDKRCLWSRQELLKATRTARAAKITILDHPPAKVVTNQDEMYGIIEKPFYDRDRIKGTFAYDTDITPKDFLDKVRKAVAKESKPLDVSIGFYYKEDNTAGTWNGQPYDLVMRNIVIDHVATGVWKGRCPAPNAGIGVASEGNGHFMPAAVPTAPVQPVVEAPKPEVPPVIPTASVQPVAVPQPITPPKIEAKPPTLNTQELIERNTQLLQLKQKRSEQHRIEALRQQRRNPLS